MDNHLTVKEIELQELIKRIQKEENLFCPNCKKFRKITNFKIYGKDKVGLEIESIHTEDLEEFLGYKYSCFKCGTRIDSEQNLGDVEV